MALSKVEARRFAMTASKTRGGRTVASCPSDIVTLEGQAHGMKTLVCDPPGQSHAHHDAWSVNHVLRSRTILVCLAMFF